MVFAVVAVMADMAADVVTPGGLVLMGALGGLRP